MRQYDDVDYTERARLVLNEILEGMYRCREKSEIIEYLSSCLRGERQEAEERILNATTED